MSGFFSFANYIREKMRTPPFRQSLFCSALMLLSMSCANAQTPPLNKLPYTNYDGSKTNDLNAAAATWVNAPEFNYNAGLRQGDWGLAKMNAQYAYALGYSGKGVKLGAVDSGLRVTHEEFAKRGNVTALTITGTYLNDGSQDDFGGPTWKAGDKFSVPGSWNAKADSVNHVGANDFHGSHVSGTIAAAKNGLDAKGQGMMGVAWGSSYYISNSNGTDASIYGSNMDYNYFHEAYGQLAKAGVRVINSSWGAAKNDTDVGTVAGLSAAYRSVESIGLSGVSTKKSWLDAAADVSKETGVLQVFAAGNLGPGPMANNPNIRASLPYFRPEIEKYWLAVAALDIKLKRASFSNACGVAKYWCVSAPGVDIRSLDITGDAAYRSASGTSMAAPHVTGAMGILMERYPTLDNQAIRTILMTTAKHVGDGSIDTPNDVFGWGIPDLQKAMNGPAQFMGVFDARIEAGAPETWSNSISEAALIQRRIENAAESAAWSARKSSLGFQNGIPSDLAKTQTPNITPGDMLIARNLLESAIKANTEGTHTPNSLSSALSAINANPAGAVLLELYEFAHPHWTGPYSQSTDFVNFIAGRSDAELMAAVGTLHAAQLMDEFQSNESRAAVLTLLPVQSNGYRGALLKAGPGSLTLTGNNSYSGGTQLQGGTLGVGSSTALGTGALAMDKGTVLQAAADGLALANAVTVSGLGNVDTQAFGLTLSGAIADGGSSGGLAKQGTGMLTLSGANTYSGPTAVQAGTLRAGSATGFSPKSAFLVSTTGTLDLDDFNQNIGSLSGSGKVSLGTATLRTGADNSATSFSGQIAGSGGLTKVGGGTFELSGANTYSGTTTVGAGTLQAGAVNTFSPASAMAVSAGATLNLMGHNQRIAGMTNAGVVSLIGSEPGTTLTVAGPWVGQNGTLKMATRLGNAGSISDRLLLSGSTAIASGSTMVQIANLGGLGARTPGNGIELLSTTGGGRIQAGAFTLVGGHVDAGAYEYRLLATGSGGFLTTDAPGVVTGQVAESVNPPGGGAPVIATAAAAVAIAPVIPLPAYRIEAPLLASLPGQLRQSNLAMLGNLRLRGGDDDVKTGTQDAAPGLAGGDRRAWGRVIATDIEVRSAGAVSPSSKGHVSGFQAGTDLLATSNWRAGVYVGQLDGDIRVNGFASGIANLRAGSNNLNSEYLGVYGAWTHDGGLYADAVLQAGRHRYTLQPFPGSAIAGRAHSLLASLEVGRSFALGNGLSIEPQLQLIRQHQSLDDAQLPGTLVQQRADAGWIARAGLRVKGELDTRAGKLQPYGRVNVYKTANGTDIARFVNPAAVTNIATPNGGTSAELAAGFTLALNQTTALYGEAGKLWSAGGNAKVKSAINASLGVRMRW